MGETLGQRIASLRHAAGLSQSQLAERAGVSTGTLKNWEQGIRQPLPAGLAAIAKGLGVSPGPLLEGVSFPAKEEPSVAPEQPPAKPPRGRPKKPASAAPAMDAFEASQDAPEQDQSPPGRRRKAEQAPAPPPAKDQGEPSGEKPAKKKPRKRKGG